MSLLIGWIINAVAVMAGSYIIPGVSVDGWVTALIVAVVLGVANAFVKPILLLLALPITLITLGLFIIVINALMVLLVAFLVPGFNIANFVDALLFGLLLSLISWMASAIR